MTLGVPAPLPVIPLSILDFKIKLVRIKVIFAEIYQICWIHYEPYSPQRRILSMHFRSGIVDYKSHARTGTQEKWRSCVQIVEFSFVHSSWDI